MAADWVWPNGSKTMPHVSSPFGKRKSFQTSNGAWASSNHKGVDLTGFSIVCSVTDGVVEKVGTPLFWSGGGHQVWVRNYDGSLARYFHLRACSHLVRVGQHVHAGQALARMGATGNASGVHLHLELVPKGRSVQVDPIPYVRNRIAATAAFPIPQEVLMAEATIIVQRENAQLAKGLFDRDKGVIVRELNGAPESEVWRGVESAQSPQDLQVAFVTVSDKAYAALLKG